MTDSTGRHAPAWHRDPLGIFEQRYWDGSRWTDHVAVRGRMGRSPVEASPDAARREAASLGQHVPPTPPPAPPQSAARDEAAYAVRLRTLTRPAGAPPTGPPVAPPRTGSVPSPGNPPLARVDDRFLWAIVAVPVVAGIIEMIAGYNPGFSLVLTVLAISANTALAQLDIRSNPALGRRGSSGGLTAWAFLLMPVYVFKRQRLLERPIVPFWVYLGLFATIIALQLTTGATNAIDTPLLESQIESWVQETFATSARVDCPDDQPARAGHRFVCELDDGYDRVGLRVEVLNSAGDVEWVILG